MVIRDWRFVIRGIPEEVVRSLFDGVVIPAHPLALTEQRRLDEQHQRALTRYYLDAGSGGLAVGVHTTQFAIRNAEHSLLRPVLELAAETISEWESRHTTRIVRIAGVIGKTAQAVKEASLASDLGYHLGLLSLAAFPDASDEQLLAHAREVAETIPLMGFYLQPAVGGRELSYDFWRRFAQIGGVVAIKIAPFNRYQTLDVIRGVADSGRSHQIALYTGNDDQIVMDLLTENSFPNPAGGEDLKLRMVGGLLGHWAVWTKSAVNLLGNIKTIPPGTPIPQELIALAPQVSDANAAIFDSANKFKGCIPGINEILRRQGLMKGLWCLDPDEELSPRQMEEIDRVCRMYPQNDEDEFIRSRIDEWKRP